jgi:hypothetical protein
MLHFTSTATTLYPIIPSDEEFCTRDYESDPSDSDDHHPSPSESSSSSAPPLSPNSTIDELMDFITDSVGRLALPILRAQTVQAMQPLIHDLTNARDQLVRCLTMPPSQRYNEEDRVEMREAVDAMNRLTHQTGMPPISQEIVHHYFEVLIPFSHRLFSEPEPPAKGEVLAIATGDNDTEIIIQPVGAPPTFTLAAAAELLRAADEEDEQPEEPPVNVHPLPTEYDALLPPNHFPVEFHGDGEENANVPYPNHVLVDRILVHYDVPTHSNPFLRGLFYRIWTLFTSWTFVNNYLHVVNRHIHTDLIPVINIIVNFTQRYRNAHEDRWVVLMIWDNIRWLYTLRGEIYLEEATRLTTAGHHWRSINLQRQLGLEAGMTWMNGRPLVPRDRPIPSVIQDILRLLDYVNPEQTSNSWDMLALRQLQTEVNALCWRHDNYTMPNDLTVYQNAAVIAIQSGYSIEGRDVPVEGNDSRETHTHFARPHHPERTIVWRLNNLSFQGEDSSWS